jgi:hypothetical protein
MISVSLYSQQREYLVMSRGMIRESLYNNGIISTPLHNSGMETVTHPQFEWPKYSGTIIDGIKYDGQHVSMGGGIHIAGSIPGKLLQENKHYAFCGLAGSATPVQTIGVWNFPIELYKIENYPVLDDGTLNPVYDPNEAEEIVVAKWGTKMGVTITRTSRAWSYPDYDDFIIHEYELVFDGNTDSNPNTIEGVVIADTTDGIARVDTVTKWVDFTMLFGHGIANNLFAYQRQPEYGGRWQWSPGIIADGNHNCFDHKLWLSFNMETATLLDDNRKAKPEPKIDLFKEWAETGKHGGGLLAAQTPGISVLHYDTKHLSKVNILTDTLETLGETMYAYKAADYELYQLPEDMGDTTTFRIKQPFRGVNSKAWWKLDKLFDGQTSNTGKRNRFTTANLEDHPAIGEQWLGRGSFTTKKANGMPMRGFMFGPYTIELGDTLEFTTCQLVGYGAESRTIMGGGSHNTNVLFTKPTHLDSFDVVLQDEDGNDTLMTSHYISDYGYPDHVNSDVVTVQQVSRKMYEMYTGDPLDPVSTWGSNEWRYWPEDNSKDGKYSVTDIPWPSPIITIKNTKDRGVRVTWKRSVEEFAHATGNLAGFNVYRGYNPMGPWKLLDFIEVGSNIDENDEYLFYDEDDELKIGEAVYYAVTSLNDNGDESGKCNINPDPDDSDVETFRRSLGAVEKLGKVTVVPNPFIHKSGFQGDGEEGMIGFYGLPDKCTIRILSYSGQLVKKLEHNSDSYSHEFFQVSRNDQVVASGIYFYVVTTPDGQQSGGKFVIVK